MCPLQLVGRWVPLDFLLLYTCPLQLLDYFGGVRRGSGRRGSAARRLPEAGLALLSPPSSPAEPRCQLGATLPDHLSLTLQLSSSPHPHLYYTRIPVKLLFYRPAYVSIPSLYRGLAECRDTAPARTSVVATTRLKYAVQITYIVLYRTPSPSPSSDADVPFTAKISVSFF